jgi:hypothetical protein
MQELRTTMVLCMCVEILIKNFFTIFTRELAKRKEEGVKEIFLQLLLIIRKFFSAFSSVSFSLALI